MLKSIATACCECTAKHENKSSCNTVHLVPDLIDFFGDDLRQANQTHFLHRNQFSTFISRWDVFKLFKNSFIKIKKQLMLTKSTLAMYKIAEKY